MQPKISVIVPVYKAEKYLHRCVDSILAQTFTDFELLLINDGSPDNSGAICDEYAKKDCRVRVFHKENGGVSSARNLGLDNAKGEWVAFVDADDYIHQDYCLSLYDKNDADLIVSSFQMVGSKENWNGVLESCYYDYISLKRNITKLVLTINFQVPWAKLFKREIIYNNNIVFDKNIHSGEDALFVLDYLTHTHTLRTLDNPYYFYEYGNNNGLSLKLHDINHNIYAMNAFYNVFTKLENAFEEEYKQAYISYMKTYCNKVIQYVYYSKDHFANKIKSLKILSKNRQAKELFSYKAVKYGKKIKLFHFMMSKGLTFISYIYIHLLKGEIYIYK